MQPEYERFIADYRTSLYASLTCWPICWIVLCV